MTQSKKLTLNIKEPLASLLKEVEEKIKKNNPNISISDYIVACLEAFHDEKASLNLPEHIDINELSSIMSEEARELIVEAKVDKIKGNELQSKIKYLRAASLELEILSLKLESELLDEENTLHTLMIILLSIKIGLGYKSLPTV